MGQFAAPFAPLPLVIKASDLAHEMGATIAHMQAQTASLLAHEYPEKNPSAKTTAAAKTLR